MHYGDRQNRESQNDTSAEVLSFSRTRRAYSERNRDFMIIYYTEFSNMLIQPAQVRQEFQDRYNRQAEALERVLVDGMERKQVRRLNAPASARIIYDLTRSLTAQRRLGWSQASPDDDAGSLLDVTWKGVARQKR